MEKSGCFYFALEKNVKERTPEKGGKTSEFKKGRKEIMEETTKNVTENQQKENQQTQEEVEIRIAENKEKQPTNEELMAQIAELKVVNQKLQNKNNTLSSENAEQKKVIRANQTAEQREADERAEALRLANEEKEAAQQELNHMKAIAAYKSISDEKTVENLIEAISESDHASVALIIEREKEKAVKEAKAEWQKSIPQPNFGTGEYSSMSKKDIMAIKDSAERQKAILANRQLFGF